MAFPSWVKPVWSGTNEEAEEMCKALDRKTRLEMYVLAKDGVLARARFTGGRFRWVSVYRRTTFSRCKAFV